LPFGLLSFSLFIKYTIVFLELDLEFLEVILRINYILTAVTAVWASLKIVDYVSFKFERKALLSPNKFDDVLVPMLKKTAKVVVISFGALFVAHSLTFDIGSILAGLGIGGVAVALAAKDTISNLFGSVTVILDRPFNIGDYIVLEKNLEGTVEQVGFRSTRIRTPINSLVSMPNSVLANMAIDNYGMRNFRRFKTTLQIEYGTDAVMIESFIQKLRYQIQLNPKIEKNEVPVQIYINELGESSINVLLSIYFIADTAQVELEERHKLIIDIMSLAHETGIKFAYPSRTLFVKKDQEL
jgi:MscS family membrane protein